LALLTKNSCIKISILHTVLVGGRCSSQHWQHHADYWQPYQVFLPSEQQAETFTVEDYKSLFRHFLARLRRKSKCYSTSMTMLLYSVILLMLQRNGNLNVIFN